MTSFLQLEFRDVALDFEGERTWVKFCIAQGSPCLTLGGLGLRKKKISNCIKKIWSPELPAPKFRNNPETTKKLQEVVETLANDSEYTFPEAGLGRNATMEIIRKHMDERGRKESEVKLQSGLSSSQSESDSSSPSQSGHSSCNGKKHKEMKLDDYFNAGKA